MKTTVSGEISVPTLYVGAGARGIIVGTILFCLISACAQTTGHLSAVVLIWVGLVPLHFGALAASLLFLRRHCAPAAFWAILDLHKPRYSWPGLAGRNLKALLGVYPAVCLITMLTAWAFSWTGYICRGSPLTPMFLTESGTFFWVSMILVPVVIAPIAEELIFRLVLFEMVKVRNEHAAAVVASLAFAMVHLIPEEVPGLFLLGMVLQKMRRDQQSLWGPIMFHAAFNGLSIVLLTVVS